jgi:hypothetical protein
MEKHLVPFNKLTFRTTLICMLLHVVLVHDQIFIESIENVHAECNIVVNLLNLGDTWNVWENRWWVMSIDFFKMSHVSGSMIRDVVPPFSKG